MKTYKLITGSWITKEWISNAQLGYMKMGTPLERNPNQEDNQETNSSFALLVQDHCHFL